MLLLPDPPPATIPTQASDCLNGGWQTFGFDNLFHCLAFVSVVPDGDDGGGHKDGALISSVRPETSAGTAGLALVAGLGLFAVGAALPVRRRRF